MGEYFNLQTFGTLVIFALVLYAIMYLTKPAPAVSTHINPALSTTVAAS